MSKSRLRQNDRYRISINYIVSRRVAGERDELCWGVHHECDTLRVGEYGATALIRVSGGGFNLSSNTDVQMVFTKPDGTSVTKALSTTGGMTVGGGVTDADLGALAANTYAEYAPEVGFLDQAGAWTVKLVYINTGASPPQQVIGGPAKFTVRS